MPCPVHPSTTKSQAQSFILFNCTENIIIIIMVITVIISGSSSNKSNSNYNNNDNKLYIDIKL